MRKTPSVLHWLFIIITISVSGIKCVDDLDCKSFYDECKSDTDCCSRNCHMLYKNIFKFDFTKYCHEPEMAVSATSEDIILPKYERAICMLNETFMDLETNEKLYSRFKNNISFSKLVPHTFVEVTYNNKTTYAQVNDKLPNFEGRDIVYLSNQTAVELDIQPGEKVLCDIKIPELVETSSYLQWLMITGIIFLVACAVYTSQAAQFQ